MTSIELFIICLFCMIVILLVIMSLLFKSNIKEIKECIDKYIEVKNKENQTSEYQLYLDFDIAKAVDRINNLVDDYISKYSLYNFSLENKVYINQDDAELMIKEITKTLTINISNYYLFLIKMSRNITTDEDLVLAIRDIVKERSLLYITEFNKPN